MLCCCTIPFLLFVIILLLLPTSIWTACFWTTAAIGACLVLSDFGSQENERRRKKAQEHQKAVDRRRKEATATLKSQMPGRFFRSVDIGGLRTAIFNAREAGVARELVQTAVAELDRAQTKYTQEAKERSQRDAAATLQAAMPGQFSRFEQAEIEALTKAIRGAAAAGVDKAEVEAAERALAQAKGDKANTEARALSAIKELRAAMPGRFSRFGAEHIDRLRIAVHDAKSCGVDEVEVHTAESALMTAEDALHKAGRDKLVAELRAAMPGMLRGADLSRLRMAISAAAADGIDVASYRAALQKERKLRHFTSMTVPELKDWCLDEGIECGSFIEKAEYTKALNIRRQQDRLQQRDF